MRVGYAYKKNATVFRKADLDRGMIFIDSRVTQYSERDELMKVLRDAKEQKTAVTVVIPSRGDLGRGAGAKAFREAIEAAGATIEIMDVKLDMDRPSDDLTVGEVNRYCPIWNAGYVPKKAIQARIEHDTGKKVNRNRMNYLCRLKPKREAAKKD